MSRANGPAVPPGGVSTRPPRQLNQPFPAAPQGQPAGQTQAPPLSASEQLAQHAFRQVQQRPQAQAYAPQFDPYAQPQQQQAPYAPPQQAYANPQPQAYEQPSLAQPAAYAPQPAYAQPAVAAQRNPVPAHDPPVPAYDQWTAPRAAPDPHGYDHGGYAPQQQDAAYQQQGYQAAALPPQPLNEWAQQQHYGQPALEPSLDAGYSEQQAYQQQGYQQQSASLEHNTEFAEEEEIYETEEAPRGRFMRIAAALAGAIVVGGGLAYAYTSLMTHDTGSPPVIKSASGPSKVKPVEPGGKKFANTDSKIMGRLNDGSEVDTSGVKKVGTLQVGADGSIMPPADAPAEAAKPAEPAQTASETSFPGSGTTLGVSAPSAPAAVAQADAPVTVLPPKVQEKLNQMGGAVPDAVKQVTAPTTTNSINAAVAAVKPAAAPAVKKVAAVAAPVAAATAPVAKKPIASAVTAAPVGNGYVAVLASVPVSTTSRINALKQFADMQQKFGPVLQNKTPDVKEATVGDKGNYHRLLVGPPGSKEGAQALCGSLKAAGYAADCWVTAY